MKNYIFVLALLFGLFSCDPNQNVDSPELREEVENRKIKQIHEPEILARALKIGGEVCSKSEMTLEKALKNQISENGIGEAISFCNLNALSLVQELEKEFNVSIRRVSLKNRNEENKPNEIETQLLDAYKYNEENNVESAESIQKIGEEYIYVKPIFVKELCLNCHGDIESNITPENHDIIKDLYPNDLATGYKAGDLRGMWSIVMQKKDVVLAISDDTWKNKKLRKPRTK